MRGVRTIAGAYPHPRPPQERGRRSEQHPCASTPLLGTQTRAHPAPSRDAARGPADGPFQPTPQGAPSRKREPIDVTELSVTPQGARGGRDVRIALLVGAILSDERHPHSEPPGDLLRQRISGGVRRSCSGLHLLGQHPMASLMIRTSCNNEIISQQRIEFLPALSWAACNGRWSWTCGTCEAHWKCFPVLPGHPQGIVEVSLHQGGQVGQGYRNFICDICMVAWRAVHA